MLRSTDILNAKWGMVLRELRRKEGMTQDQVATQLQYNRTSVTNIEKGRQAVTMVSLVLLLNILGYDLEVSLIRVREGGYTTLELERLLCPAFLEPVSDQRSTS